MCALSSFNLFKNQMVGWHVCIEWTALGAAVGRTIRFTKQICPSLRLAGINGTQSGSRVSNTWPHPDEPFKFQRLPKPPKPKHGQNKYPADEVVALFKKTLGIFLRDNTGTLHDYDWEKCKQAAQADKESTTPHRLAHILNFCKKTGTLDVEFMGDLMGYVLIDPTAPSDITPVEASMVVQCIGMLSKLDARKEDSNLGQKHHDFFATVGRPFVVQLLDECLARDLFDHKRFRPWELSNTLHGLGALVQSTGGVGRTAEAAIVENAVDSLLKQFMKKSWIRDREGECTPQDFANILHGCVNLVKFCDIDRGLVGGVVENMRGVLSTQVPMSEQDLANVVWALGKLGIQHRELLGVLCWRMTDSVGSFKAQSLASIVYGLGLLRFHKKELMIKIGKQVVSSERIHEFKLQELTNIVYGFGLSGFFDARIFMILLKHMGRRMDKFSAREVSNIVYGLGLLKPKGIDMISKSVSAFLDVLVMDVLARNRKSFNSQDVANLCWGCGRLLFYDEELMGFLVGRYMELVESQPTIQDLEIRMILEACHVLDYLADDFYDFATEALGDRVKNERSDESEVDSDSEQGKTEPETETGWDEVQKQPKKESYQDVIDELAGVNDAIPVDAHWDRAGRGGVEKGDGGINRRINSGRGRGSGRNEQHDDGNRQDNRSSENGRGKKSWGDVLRRPRTRRERANLYEEFNALVDGDQSLFDKGMGGGKPPVQ